MKAVLCREWGPAERLSLGEVPVPRPGEGQVRIRVRACGLNFADALIIQGRYQERPEFPFSPGIEVAGEVLELGAGVTRPTVGQRVIALCGLGGFAEQVLASAAVTTDIPDEMDYPTAGGFGVAYGTAHVALQRRADLQPGETLLVHGAGGGVGLAAVEVGKLMGARVIATAGSREKLALAERYGADQVINYREGPFREAIKRMTQGRGADVVFDPVGGEVFDQSVRCINWEGRLLVIGFAGGDIPQLPVNLALVKNFSVVGLYWGAYAKRRPQVIVQSWQQLLGWFALGKLRPHVSRTYPLEEAASALNSLVNRESTGKVVLTMGDR